MWVWLLPRGDGGTRGARGALLPAEIGIDLEVEELGRWGDGGVGKTCGRVLERKKSNPNARNLGGKKNNLERQN